MRPLWIIIWIINIVLWTFIAVVRFTDLTPDAHGIIHHPFYGAYPATVPFEEGMTIRPGQRTVGRIPVPMPKEAI